MNNTNTNQIDIKKILAEHVGTEVDEIKNEYSIENDLHMSASEFSDFLRTLEAEGVDTSKIDITEIETVDDLVEAFGD